MRAETIEDVLVGMRVGGWFGFGGKEKTYSNLIIHSGDEKPTQEWLVGELKRQQDAYDSEQADKARKRSSAKAKLKVLGLTSEELKEAFGL